MVFARIVYPGTCPSAWRSIDPWLAAVEPKPRGLREMRDMLIRSMGIREGQGLDVEIQGAIDADTDPPPRK